MAQGGNGGGNAMKYAGLATQMMVMLLLAVWAGHKLDNYLHWKVPLCTILFPLIALVVSLLGIIREFNKPKK